MDERPYSNRELDEKFLAIHDRFDKQEKTSALILTQTTKHNGRLTRMERNLLIVACVLGTTLILKGSELVAVLKTFLL